MHRKDKPITTGELYYYFTTRDTNVVVSNGTINGGWTTGQTKPFTLTSTSKCPAFPTNTPSFMVKMC